MPAVDETSHVLVKGTLSTPTRQVVPNGNPHVSSVFAFLYFRSLPCSSESLSANQLLVTGLFYQQSHLFVAYRSEEHTSELQSRGHLVCRLLLEKKKNTTKHVIYCLS